MKFLEIAERALCYFAGFFTFSPFSDNSSPQQALSFHNAQGHPFPEFPAPNGPDDPNINFTCRYPALGPDWTDCSTETNRGCWLRHKNGTEFNIKTDYEAKYPPGVVRTYYLEVGSMTLNADGVVNPDGKVFNQSYPGPWIKACWGDKVEIKIKNNLVCNGTSIHWHGIRQLGTVQMDGVNGVTQCPIAPGDSFKYNFRAMQYGSTWYHSHYSLQYADGLAGPLTIFGPSSDDYDEAIDPILISDWNHRSAFKDYNRELTQKPDIPKMNSVLINGLGSFAGVHARERYTLNAKKGKKYLMRIINTSVDTTYIFAIDNHNFTVISSDFVPIVPYNATNVTVAIGQRYHIVLIAEPIAYKNWLPVDGNYWIRVIAAAGCQSYELGNTPDERQGILRYDWNSAAMPVTWRDASNADITCSDREYAKLEPVLPWSVDKKNLPDDVNNMSYPVGLNKTENRPQKGDRFRLWAIGNEPMWLNYEQPTIMNLDRTTWPPEWVVSDEFANATADQWLFIAITMPGISKKNKGRMIVPAAHPIHLHGHDFALIAQGTDWSQINNQTMFPRKFDNPPRRDVALLPNGGFLIIAFKADNPGSWLMHCHIAWHASSGLALQVMERQKDLEKLSHTDGWLEEPIRVCQNWETWFNKTGNTTACIEPGVPFQEDSGI